jgi:hypothetical protein
LIDSRAIRAIAAAALCGTAAAHANDAPRQFSAVMCISEAGGPWSARERGTLTRTKSKDALTYDLKLREVSFSWRFVTTPEGATSAVAPGFLLDRFVPTQAKPEDRKQNLYASGEIREHSGANALVLVIGSKCPATRKR